MYIKRLIETLLKQKMEINGAVSIVGPKAVGKTSLGEHFTKTQIYLKENNQVLELVKVNNSIALDGEFPRLIDEWQEEPFLWNAVKTRIDKEKKHGLYVLTGSSAPDEKTLKILHSGAERISKIHLRTMSLTEMNLSLKKINFLDLVNGKKVVTYINDFSLNQYSQIIVKGGWPTIFSLNEKQALDKMIDYVENIYFIDLKKISSPPDSKRMEQLMLSLSRNIATQVEIKKLTNESKILNEKTTRKYLDQLAQIYILDELEPWNKHIRSSVRLTESPKYYFIDPAIASAALHLDSNKLLNESNTFGLFFESLVIKELKIYAELLNGKAYFYRDSTGLEIDAIIEFRNGDFSAFEVKLGSDDGIEKGITALKRFESKLDKDKLKNLKSLNIITAGKMSFVKQGVNVFPLINLFVKI